MINHTTWLPYTQMHTAAAPLNIVRTQAEFLYDSSGQRYIDAISSWWTACFGYAHPHIIQEIQNQAQVLPHVMLGGIIHPQAQKLCDRLVQLLPGDLNHVFLANTGSESVEIALKMAIQYSLNRGQNAHKFLHFRNAYHGDTLYAMSVCDPEEGMHRLFHNVLPSQIMVDIPSSDSDWDQFDATLKRYKKSLAGVILEPLVQGAGGMIMHTEKQLQKIASICKENHIPLILDEIFTGFGRTGSLFALEQANVIPDIICLSKALTGGTLPLAAVIAREQIYESFLDSDPEKALMHGPTFMGNAIACSAANAALDLFEELPWLQQVKNIEQKLVEDLRSLQDLPQVKAIRVKGAIGAIELAQPIANDLKWFTSEFLKMGVWCRPFGNIVYTTPPFNIQMENLDRIIQAMQNILRRWKI